MQKQLKNINKFDVECDPSFPIYCFSYTQQYKTYTDMHAHGLGELGICIEGSGLFFVDNKIYTFQKGDMSYIEPDSLHIAQSADQSPSKWYFISFDTAYFDTKTNGSLLFHNNNIYTLARLLVNELLESESDRRAVELLLKTCMHLVSKTEAKKPDIESEKEFSAVLPALQYILQKYREEIGVKALANECHLSVSRFGNVFKHSVGISPMAYLAEVRMAAAANLLRETDRSVMQIASDVGYDTLSSFNREFKKTYAISPLRYRKSMFNSTDR